MSGQAMTCPGTISRGLTRQLTVNRVVVRLPSEAEWEYAARGPDSLLFPWGNEFDRPVLNFCDLRCGSPGADSGASDGYALTGPVGSYPGGASWVGALDMAGNLWEWTSGLPYDYPYRADDGREVGAEVDSSSFRTLRGGAWIDTALCAPICQSQPARASGPGHDLWFSLRESVCQGWRMQSLKRHQDRLWWNLSFVRRRLPGRGIARDRVYRCIGQRRLDSL